MRKIVSIFLVFLLLCFCTFTAAPMVHASQKNESSRAISIVFDNSGSMYIEGEQAWCRATYAMEVFASMLNKGDILQIYPMHPITVGENEYTMDSPFKVSDAAHASTIRDIYTNKALGTPIESVDAAVNGLKQQTAEKKYMIVLTDGDAFYINGSQMSISETKSQLDARFIEHAGEDMTVMYLGIGENVVMPDTEQSKYFVKKQAKNSEDTLSALTEMCNRIFGRDTLPTSHLSGNSMKLDISISKLIVFVQGENVSDLKVTGNNGEIGGLENTASTKYGTAGCGNYDSVADESLQGMMVTYADCAAGNYTIEYNGTATNIEVYYEPDADLDFVFTDAEGNLTDPNTLYEGDYKVSFGMKDAKTGQLISSELLGNPHYEGSYSINGQEYPFTYDGKSGEVPVTLEMNDAFDADLTVTYLSGYTITKDSSDFGWPEGGIKVAARPAGDLKLEITGGDSAYSLQDLEKGKAFTAEVYYQGEKLTGEELESVQLNWESDSSYADIKTEFADDHYNLSLHYKDPKMPANTVCGQCKVPIQVAYAAKGSEEAKAQATLTYQIDDDFTPLKIELFSSDDYIVISKLDESSAIVAKLSMDGKPLTEEEFKKVTLQVDCGGIEYKVTQNVQDSSYSIQLLPTSGIAENDYPINVTAKYTDNIGRETESKETTTVTLSHLPIWVKRLIGFVFLLLLIYVIWRIMHIRVLPKVVRQQTNECYMGVTGKNMASGTDFRAKRSGKKVEIKAEYNSNIAGIAINNVSPAKNSYLITPQHKRKILVKPENISMIGDVTHADINGVTYSVDKNGRLVPDDEDPRPFTITHGASITFDGKLEDGGKTKKFHSDIPLTFKK